MGIDKRFAESKIDLFRFEFRFGIVKDERKASIFNGFANLNPNKFRFT